MARTKGKIAPVRYPRLSDPGTNGVVKAILDERGRSAPLAQVEFAKGQFTYLPAVAGISVGREIQMGAAAVVSAGNILPLTSIPEGTRVCNIELRPGDGGRLVRASGTSAILFSKAGGNAILKLPSGKNILVDARCRAAVGEIAGGGRHSSGQVRGTTRCEPRESCIRGCEASRWLQSTIRSGEGGTSTQGNRQVRQGTRRRVGRSD